ncbi:MAG: 2 3-bisphosphoglycerate-independent phosphoglycerate mutase [Gallionellaceae bacterium]|nr:MAG: 2 3-bisphosphoglycerate-independent phosphoglycerate mutase [Gallionellaceae bacterium]
MRHRANSRAEYLLQSRPQQIPPSFKAKPVKNIHIVIPALFLPQAVAADVCGQLNLRSLEILLARARPEPLAQGSLETWLCGMFGVAEAAVAPVTLRADGIEPGTSYWLRSDPVHLLLRGSQMVLQAEAPPSAGEASRLCDSLNVHFAGDGMHFFAPHPLRWYLRLDDEPGIQTRPLSQVAGQDIRAQLPQGRDALRWHAVLNEIQMLFHDHAVNREREARGETPINSVWLWGGGRGGGQLARPCAKLCGDSELADAFAPRACLGGGDVLLVWEGLQRAVLRGDLRGWRDSLLHFEQRCAAPLLGALRAGRIAQIVLDVPGEAARRFVLARGAAWMLWRRARPLAGYGAPDSRE